MRCRVPGRRAVVALLFATSVAAAGCAHADSAADRHIREMREAIGKIEAEQDLTNQRLELLEADGPRAGRASGAAATRPGGAPATAAGAAPRSPVAAPPSRSVQIGDADAAHESDDPNDPTARPEIRLQGAAGGLSSRPVRGKSTTRGRSDARTEADDAPSDGSRAPILDPEAKKSYDAALALVNGRQYDRALEALGSFLTRWPDHPYAENAMYWRGEVHYARGEYLRAAEQFEAVLTRGMGQKAPDALLKIGLCHDRLGSSDRAREYWERLRRDYPRSDAAKKIPGTDRSSTERPPGGTDDRGAGPKESR